MQEFLNGSGRTVLAERVAGLRAAGCYRLVMAVDGWLYDEVTAGRLKKTGRNPTDRGKQGVKRSLMTDANGLPLSLVVSGANTHDI